MPEKTSSNQLDPLVTPVSPLGLIHTTYEAIKTALAQSPDSHTDPRLTINLPDEFAPLLRMPEGLTLFQQQQKDLLQKLLDLRWRVAEVGYTVVGTQVGDYFHAKGFRPNPELQARLQDRALEFRRQCAEPLRTTRLLGCYDSLSGLFHDAEGERREMESATSDPDIELADREKDMVTTPDDLKQLRIPSVLVPLEQAAEALGKSLKRRRRRGKKVTVSIPEVLRPRPYAEGMRQIWTLTEQATHIASTLSSELRELCLTLLRTELGERAATGSASHPEFASEVEVIGIILTIVLEDTCRNARLMWDAESMNKCLGQHQAH